MSALQRYRADAILLTQSVQQSVPFKTSEGGPKHESAENKQE